ncbi:MAG: HesA/MoeB/ThiF family protein [Candidatus Heimdallarchaeaceae archaeon]
MSKNIKDKSNFFDETFSKEERKRFDRQLRLPGWNQKALKDSTVVIAGVGGLGTEIAKNLAMAGVGKLHLIDLDIIEYSNLNRQILFSDADEGEPKSRVAARTLKRINPYCRYIWHHSNLEDIDPEVYVSADLLISGLDSVTARGELNRRAVHYKKPMIDGGTVTYYGHVYTYLPGQNACLQCDPQTERERETLAACTLVGIPRKRSHCLLKGQLYFESKHNRPPDTGVQAEMKVVLDYANKLTKENFPKETLFSIDEVVKMVDQHDPTIITINAVIASLQSQEALKLLHHVKGIKLGTVNAEYAIYNGLIGKFFYFEKPPNKKCMLCGKDAALIERLKLPRTTTVENILSILKNKGYEYDLDFLPSFWKIDKKDTEEVKLDLTLGEQGIRNYETFYVSGVLKNKKEVDLYIHIKLV